MKNEFTEITSFNRTSLKKTPCNRRPRKRGYKNDVIMDLKQYFTDPLKDRSSTKIHGYMEMIYPSHKPVVLIHFWFRSGHTVVIEVYCTNKWFVLWYNVPVPNIHIIIIFVNFSDTFLSSFNVLVYESWSPVTGMRPSGWKTLRSGKMLDFSCCPWASCVHGHMQNCWWKWAFKSCT